jgi:hypothetical protein
MAQLSGNALLWCASSTAGVAADRSVLRMSADAPFSTSGICVKPDECYTQLSQQAQQH